MLFFACGSYITISQMIERTPVKIYFDQFLSRDSTTSRLAEYEPNILLPSSLLEKSVQKNVRIVTWF